MSGYFRLSSNLPRHKQTYQKSSRRGVLAGADSLQEIRKVIRAPFEGPNFFWHAYTMTPTSSIILKVCNL
jgi:hypothetical protein